MPERAQAGLHPLAVGDRRGVEVVGHPRRVDQDGARGLALRVEHPQRVGLDLGGVVRRQVAGPLAKPAPAGRRRRRSRSAGVPMKLRTRRHCRRPERGQERVAEGDHLDVDVRIRRADALDAHLVVLAQPAGLGLLVAEGRRGVPDLPRHRRAVLDVGTGDRRRALGTQRHVASALVVEVVHLLGDDVGALTDPLEHADVLEHRRLDQPVAEPVGDARERGEQRLPARRLRRQHVLGALGGPEVRTVGHGGRGYRLPPDRPEVRNSA